MKWATGKNVYDTNCTNKQDTPIKPTWDNFTYKLQHPLPASEARTLKTETIADVAVPGRGDDNPLKDYTVGSFSFTVTLVVAFIDPLFRL